MLKYELIPAQLLREGILAPEDLHSPEIVEERYITKTHDPDYWQRIKNQNLSSGEVRRIGFPLTTELVERETRIVAGTIDGCIRALDHGIAFNVAGGTHHAGSNWGEGFCLLNDQAIAANYLLEHQLANRILVIDLDVHQGNGTADLFRNNDRVFTLSMHAQSNFPFRKEISDLDIGLPDGIGDKEYLSLLQFHTDKVLHKFKPDFVFYQSGVDVLATDKLGKLSLSQRGCMERDRIVLSFCYENRLPVQVSMGGGYSPEIGHIVDAHCNTFRVGLDLFG